MLNTPSKMIKIIALVCSWLLLFMGSITPQSYAQDVNASLRGTVTDPSGAAVPGAQLALTNIATKYQATALSSQNGEYNFQNLTPGTYDLRVDAKGFQAVVQTGIELTINQTAQVNLHLSIGQETSTVTVTAGVSELNYENATLQGGIAPEVLNQLPLTVSGAPRSSISLATLMPGVSTPSNNAYDARINGGTQSGDEAMLDGATMMEGFMNQSGMVSLQGDFQMSPDMVSEVKVLGSNYAPQYGTTTSGQLIVETKSGSDRFHGAAFEYLRNDAMNALQYGTPAGTKAPDKENNYGGNVGGPILIPWLLTRSSRNKGYFYFDWEGLSVHGGVSPSTLSLPSLADRAGDFSNYKDATGNMIQIYNPQTGQAFPNNQIPTTLEDPISKAWIAALPNPTNSAETNNYLVPKSGQGSLVSNENVYVWRVDLTVHDNDHLYYTYWWQYSQPNTQSDLPTAVSTAVPANPENSPVQRFNWEHTFSPVMTNHFTIGYLNRNEGYYSLNAAAKLPAVSGVANTAFLPTFDFGSGFSGYGSSDGAIGNSKTTRPTYAINDLFTRIHGNHTLKFGIEWRNIGGNLHSSTNQGGTFTFNADTTANLSVNSVTGDPMAGFFLGAASTANVAFLNVPNYYPRQKMWAADAGDTWRLTPKLTFNYGMRWDVFTPSQEKYDHLSFFDPLGVNPDTGGLNLPGRLAFAGNKYGAASYGAAYPEQLFNKGFAPRVGAAYALNEKTVLTGGYGIYFGQAFYPGWNAGMSLDGFNLNDTINSVTQSSGLTTPAFYLSQGFRTPTSTSNINSGFDNGLSPLYRPFDGNRRPYSSQWNFTLQRELPQNVALTASYVGTKGTHLGSVNNPINVLNPFSPTISPLGVNLKDAFGPNDTEVDGVAAPYPGWYQQVNGNCGATVAQALLPFPQYCGVLQGLNEGHGNSFYSSIQLRVERRFQKGLYGLASFTGARLTENASDNTQTSGEGTTGNTGTISPYNIKRVYSLAPDNVPKILSVAAVYSLPFGRDQLFLNSGGLVNTVVGGWRASPVFHYNAGIPMWFTSSTCNVVPQLREGCIPGLVSGTRVLMQDPSHYNPAQGRLVNPAALENASSSFAGNGAFGYTGYGQRVSGIGGPNYRNLDISFIKTTPITERISFILQANFFNAFNNHYFVTPGGSSGGPFAFNNDISNSNFGEWNGTVSAPRTIQFAGRIQF